MTATRNMHAAIIEDGAARMVHQFGAFQRSECTKVVDRG